LGALSAFWIARRRRTVEVLERGREDCARARWAFVGGLKEESRMYNGPFWVCEEEFRILNVEEDDMKDWTLFVYVREDIREEMVEVVAADDLIIARFEVRVDFVGVGRLSDSCDVSSGSTCPSLFSPIMATSTLLLFLSLVLHAFALYDPSGPVLLLNPKSFDTKIRNSNHSSIVEFFAPWLPHSLNLI
jgi:hypothetical protein